MRLPNWMTVVTHCLGIANAISVVHSVEVGTYSLVAINGVAMLYIARYGR